MLRVRPENGKTYYLIIHDVAGEYANVTDGTLTYLLNKTAFRMADSLIAMFDCSQFCQNDARFDEARCNEQYLKALLPLGKYADLRKKLKTGLAVITKCDGIFDRPEYIHGSIDDNANDCMVMVSEDMATHKNSLNLSVVQRVEEEILAVLNRCMGLDGDNGIEQRMARELKNSIELTTLPVSTYVRKIDSSGRVTLAKDINAVTGHFRLIEPLLYLMYKHGMIPGEEKGITEYQRETVVDDERKGFFAWLFGKRH